MGSNRFGNIFTITTWGESHGKAIGVVIDGCPAGLKISEQEINAELVKRAPGNSPLTSPRKEDDLAEIYSGVFEGKTTGAPISIIIQNKDADSSKYEPIKELLRPGHANYTYLEKYGIFDYRGGGRASGRETACRVAAGAVAKKLLSHFSITIGSEILEPSLDLIEQCKQEGDSIGGIIQMTTSPLPIGLGDPVYEKLEANLAKAFLSLPATKGFEIGEGFAAAKMRGSCHNDTYPLKTNYAGGTLGGISSGAPLVCRIAFKPTSSIALPQPTTTQSGASAILTLPPGSRHDPCVALRALPVCEAMGALVLADAILLHRCARV